MTKQATTAAEIKHVAGLLEEAARTRKPVPPIRGLLPDGDVEAAYAVQQWNTQRALDQGRRKCGLKIGLTSPAVQRQLGVNQPDFGVLWSDMAVADGEEIDWSRTLQPKAEAEIAFVMEKELNAVDATMTDLIGAIAYATPAIEVVGSRIEGWKINIVDTVADNASSGLYVLGTAQRRVSSFDARLCGMVMERRGDQVSIGVGAACMGHPLLAALWLARKMSALGTPLSPGDVVLSGALGPMVSVAPGDVIEARVSGLGSVRAVFGKGTES